MKSKKIWIILAVIVALIAAVSIANCFTSKTAVNYSEFKELIAMQENDGLILESELEAGKTPNVAKKFKDYSNYQLKFSSVEFDGYVVNFNISYLQKVF